MSLVSELTMFVAIRLEGSPSILGTD